ncbi:MAG: PAS domain S-box protein, partial [Ktedonobacteraceae bacterium]|nr:PAS domain S-box protein [Ktedonobacteraceae bacterium]
MRETHYQRAIESTGMGIYYRDLASRHVVWSDEAKAILGLPAEAEESCDLLLSVTHPEDRERLAQFLAEVDTGPLEGGIEHRVIWPDGSLHWVLARRGILRNEQGEPVRLLGVTVDITALKHAEERQRQADRQAQHALQTAHEHSQRLVKELERKQAFLDAIMEQAPSALVIVEAPSGKILRYNQAARKLLDQDLLESQHYLQYPPRWHEDGTLFRREEYPLVRALVKEEVVIREPMCCRFSDGRMRHVEVSAAPVYDEAGRMLVAVATFIDVSERFELERKKDAFICVAGHELRTPLTSIKGSLQLMQRYLLRLLTGQPEDDTKTKRMVEQLARWNERALRQADVESRLVNDLLDATRLQSGELRICPHPCNLVQVVQQEVEDLQAAARARVIELDLPETEEIPVLADEVRIGQVVANFVTNALKYSPAHEPVQVGLAHAGKQARVWVRDYGMGLSPEAQRTIWDRFRPVTTFAEYSGIGVSGLGLGLHISRELIEQHGGETGVESVPGEGS